MRSSIFTDQDFWHPFVADVSSAHAQVVIQSPFVTARRVKFLANVISSLTKRHVSVCVFVQEPRNASIAAEMQAPESAYDLDEFRAVTEMLRGLGTHVNVRKGIHAKLALVDDRILWEGSLNILSFANTKEHMRRWENRTELKRTANLHRLYECDDCQRNRLEFGYGLDQSLGVEQFCQAIAKQRLRLQLSQRQLGKKCGLSAGRISEIEAGQNITLSTLLRVADPLELRPILLPALYIPTVTKVLQQLASSEKTKSKMRVKP